MGGKSKSVASHIGEKLTKPSKGGSRREVEHEVERVGSRREVHNDGSRFGQLNREVDNDGSRFGKLNRQGRREGFQVDEEPSSWLWGTLFLIAIIFALSPGVLLTLPPGKGGVWMSGNTSTTAAFVHATLIALIFNYI